MADLRAVLLLGLVPWIAPGCLGGGPDSFCETADATLVVDEVTGTDVLADGRSLVLHAAESKVYLRTDTGCQDLAVASIQAGDVLAHDADAIAESYPAQAWPDHVLVER